MTSTARHALPLLESGQAQKEITHNEAIVTIDRLLQLSVASRRLLVPPDTAVAGDCHIVPDGAEGAWAGQSGNLACSDGFGWHFIVPRDGFLAWIVDERLFAIHDGGWVTDAWPAAAILVDGRRLLGATPVPIVPPGGGGTVDAECRAVLTTLLAALRGQGLVS